MLVPPAGIEPALQYRNRILNPARLPVPPEGHNLFELECGQYSIAAGQVNHEDGQDSIFNKQQYVNKKIDTNYNLYDAIFS